MRLFYPEEINFSCIHRRNSNFVSHKLRIWFPWQNQPTYSYKHPISFLGLHLLSSSAGVITYLYIAAHTQHETHVAEAARLQCWSYHLERDHAETQRDHTGRAQCLPHHLQQFFLSSHDPHVFGNISKYHFSTETRGLYQGLHVHWIAQNTSRTAPPLSEVSISLNSLFYSLVLIHVSKNLLNEALKPSLPQFSPFTFQSKSSFSWWLANRLILKNTELVVLLGFYDDIFLKKLFSGLTFKIFSWKL